MKGTAELKSDHQRQLIENKHVIVVEDIIDSGTTMQTLLEALYSLNAASVVSAIAFDKYNPNRKITYVPEYVGFNLKLSHDKFIVGYGTDYNEWFRDVPHLFILNQWGIEQKKNGIKPGSKVMVVDVETQAAIVEANSERINAFST